MQECNDALRFFGTASVQELLGWFDLEGPDLLIPVQYFRWRKLK